MGVGALLNGGRAAYSFPDYCSAQVLDNPRHASLSLTSTYLHSDDLRQARQIGGAFEALAA
jgi:hypothetical protein